MMNVRGRRPGLLLQLGATVAVTDEVRLMSVERAAVAAIAASSAGYPYLLLLKVFTACSGSKKEVHHIFNIATMYQATITEQVLRL